MGDKSPKATAKKQPAKGGKTQKADKGKKK